ncbi:MAG TPA: GPP34 family phosphoprotein [Micromonosporaceae bacterium]
MLLADEFFLLAHDEMTGKPKLRPKIAGMGLAAALLAELVLANRITVHGGALSVQDRRPPADALAHTVLDQLIGEPEHRDVRVWLEYLGRSAHESVGERLARAGVVRRQSTRRLLATTTTYVPIDINDAAWPTARLRALLDRGEAMNLSDTVLLGLIEATGLSRAVLSRSGEEVRRLLATLPPPLIELITQTEATVAVALTPR